MRSLPRGNNNSNVVFGDSGSGRAQVWASGIAVIARCCWRERQQLGRARQAQFAQKVFAVLAHGQVAEVQHACDLFASAAARVSSPPAHEETAGAVGGARADLSQPCILAWTTSSTALRRPNRLHMLLRCLRTVCSLMPSAHAMSLQPRPVAIASSTSSSRAVNGELMPSPDFGCAA